MRYINQILAISGWVWLVIFSVLLLIAEIRRARRVRREQTPGASKSAVN